MGGGDVCVYVYLTQIHVPVGGGREYSPQYG